MQEGLLRQRRNLISICVLLWFAKYAGVTLTKFSFVGFDVKLENSNALYLAIWIAFFYFLYRYYQYFSDEGVKRLYTVFNQAIEKECSEIIKKMVFQKQPKHDQTSSMYSYSFLRHNNWIVTGRVLGEYDVKTSKVPVEEFHISIRKSDLIKGYALAIADSTLRNSVVTDYVLPFALAGFVIFYCGETNWNGGLISITIDTLMKS